MISVGDVNTEIIKTEDKKNITYLERNGKTFMIIEHYSGEQTYVDIIKNAMRREFESQR